MRQIGAGIDTGDHYTAAMSRQPEIVILGSGVIGMTTAICLSEAGAQVHVVADRPHQDTTSALAGALWGPYAVSDERILEWSLCTLEELRRLASDEETGVRVIHGGEASRVLMEPPAWLHGFEDFRLADDHEVPAGYTMGWTYSAPVVDMPVYLRYLRRRLDQHGVHVEIVPDPVRSLGEVITQADTVVNCTGLGARALVPDPSVVPKWGQLVVVANPGVTSFFSDYPETEEPTYYIAHPDHVILGGCIFDDGVDDVEARAAASRIVERCSRIEPRLKGAEILAVRTGLRPVRPEVRLDLTVIDGTTVVHNYGHGGSGLTLSWGCARQVRRILGRPPG